MNPDPVLAWTLSAQQQPGSNMPGGRSGASWTFLLPSLDLGRVVCLGSPGPAAESTLARLAEETIIVDDGSGTAPSSSDDARVHRAAESGRLAAATADVVAITGRATRDRIAEARRLVARDGLIYRESRGQHHVRAGHSGGRPAAAFEAYWRTPILGEASTAVPLGHSAALRHFVSARLDAAAFDATLVPALRRLVRPPRSGAGRSPDAPTGVSLRHAERSRLAGSARRVILRGVDAIAAAERLAGRHLPPLRRLGIMEGPAERLAELSPPGYLVRVARASGMDISTMEWSLDASAPYESQKVLIHLFARGDSRPRYIAKLARSPAVSPRLENAYRGLEAVRALPAAVASRVPTAVFHGRHHHLTIVGETAVDGTPFRARSSAQPDCPLAGQVIGWIIELGRGSARPVAGAALGAALDELRRRLVVIYAPTDEEDRTLVQMAHQVRSQGNVPAVLQHGDPGTWNMLATNDGEVRILDWENAEPAGLPLADLIEFVRSFAVLGARAVTLEERIAASVRPWSADEPIARMARAAMHRYAMEVQVPQQLMEPLLAYAFVYQAVKEAPRLRPEGLGRGMYFGVLRRLLARRSTDTLA